MCGPSGQETTAAGNQENLANTLSQNYTQNFGKQSALLGSITNGLMPIFEAGPNQQGFSAAENAALTGGAINANAAAYKRAATIAGANNASAGGTTYAPTGGQQAVQAGVATAAAENLGNEENKIQEENYAVGRENFQNAETGLFGVSSGYNPAAYGSEATNANSAAFSDAQQMNQESNAWVGDVTGLIGGLGGAAIGAWCPAAGTMYRLADGTLIPVEMLLVGDKLQGIDGEAQTIEEIQSAYAKILRITTDDGHVVRNSRTHAFALPYGGFVVALNSLGKTIRTENGVAKVVSVEDDGIDKVFNVITDGSHTYCADGVWALGVGEAERQVSMYEWNRIADRLELTVKV